VPKPLKVSPGFTTYVQVVGGAEGGAPEEKGLVAHTLRVAVIGYLRPKWPWLGLIPMKYVIMAAVFGLCNCSLVEASCGGQPLRLRPFRSPQWLLSCTKTHSTMAGTRASGELLAGRAVCQRMRSSSSSSSSVAAMFRHSHLIHADASHSATFLLDPISFRNNSVGCYLWSIDQLHKAGGVRGAHMRTLKGWLHSTAQLSCQAAMRESSLQETKTAYSVCNLEALVVSTAIIRFLSPSRAPSHPSAPMFPTSALHA
jgi:hypothetical protein